MDFFNSLAQVVKNNKNFKTWEQEQQNQQAQREELYRKNKYSDAEIVRAEQLGERIVDVIDIMDNHSENVAENVETAVQPFVGFIPLLSTGLAGYIFFRTGLLPLKTKGSELIQELWNDEKIQDLLERINKERKQFRKSANEVYVSYFLRKADVEKIRDPQLRKEALEIHNHCSKLLKPFKRTLKRGIIGVAATAFASLAGANILAAKVQVDSSKIARYQARKVLEDPKALVNYTPEQIEQAKKYIEEHPELKKAKQKEKLNSGMIKSISGIIRDRRAYLKAKANDKDTSQKVTRTLTAEELDDAQRDKDVIQRTVRLINNEAEKYSENMEVAANVIMGTTPIMGGLTGWLAGVLMNKTGLTDKMISKFVNKSGSEKVKEAYNRFKELKSPKDPGYTTRWGKFVGALMDDYNKIDFDEAGRIIPKDKKTIRKEIALRYKKIFTAVMAHKNLNNKILGLFAGVISAIPAALIALNLQKSSARAGRFTAKRELEKDPKNFIGFTDEEYNQVKDIKGHKKTFGEQFKEYALFIPTVLKQYWAYNKYKRNEFKDHQLLTEQLQKMDVTDEQMRDAKNLQRKLFNTFEKVDDNSQVYSESMEAATEIMQPVIIYSSQAVMLAPIVYGIVKLIKGKQSPADFFVSASEKLANASKFLKSKFVKKYLESVEKNIPQRIGDIDLKYTPIAALVKDIDFKNGTISQVLEKLLRNIQSSADAFNKMDEYEQVSILRGCRDFLKKILDIADVKPNPAKDADDAQFEILNQLAPLNKIVYFLDELSSYKYSTQERADMLSFVIGKNKYQLDKDLSMTIPQDRIRAAKINIANILNKMNEKYNLNFVHPELAQFTYKYQPHDIEGLNEEIIAEFFTMLDKMRISNIKFSELSKIPVALNELINNIPKKNFEKIMRGEQALPRSFVNELEDKNPLSLKQILKNLKTKYSEKSEEEVNEILDRLNLGSMDKAKLMKILDNFEKMLNNIPSEEIAKVHAAMIKALKENPDEFISLVRSGRAASLFVTPMLVKTAAAAGISWIALNVIITWLIETWLADLQLKAGRLGVMKAMESLQDPAYYADTEPVENNEKKQDIPFGENANLLDKFKKQSV